ncbi:MAG: PQQ-binding-like beta-propeller repeat protein [Gemmatimonadota bacterium]
MKRLHSHGAHFRTVFGSLTLAVAISAAGCDAGIAGEQVAVPEGEWWNITSDGTGTRYLGAEQIDASNFNDLQVAWEWDGAEDAGVDLGGSVNARGLPIYARGKLITTSGPRRTVVALDPATGETIWTFQEPMTFRTEYSPRNNHGKGVTYAEIDGRGIVFVTTPGLFLHALDADTGEPLENWGTGILIEGFPASGSIDVVADILDGWPRWENMNQELDPDRGPPLELGFITSSSPPIVVNDVVVVGNSAEQGYNQSRIENIPGDIVAYDARTGDRLWKFHMIPREGEFGYDTWEEGSAEWSGNVGSWAPLSADPERGLVFVPTKGGVIDYYGGFRKGDNLFGNSVVALDVQTGERVWHYQMVHHDIWNYDSPTAPILMDVTVDGQEIPGVFQATKQAYLFAFNRETGEPIWPIEERPIPQSKVPGEQLSATQPHPTWPLPYDRQGRTEEDLIDYTPELYQMAYDQAVRGEWLAPFWNPPVHRDNPEGAGPARICPGDTGGVNITGPAAADPRNGIIFITSHSSCISALLVPGEEVDRPNATGETVARYAQSGGGSGPPDDQAPDRIDGLSIWKGLQGRISAIDLNTGDYLWTIPHGEMPQSAREHPLLEGIDVPEQGRGGHAAMMATQTLLLATGMTADNTPHLFGIDKQTGERVGQVPTPRLGAYGLMGYVHEGKQYVVMPRVGGYTTLALP